MDMLSLGLRELDLSYCNLSVVPDGIGLLHRLVDLDLSGNNFASLPANISLLSNLRMLCLNNCKRLQTLPKLSIVNEDTLYGLPMRFNYIISKKRVDVSKFHARSNNTCPKVSCLNCPKVAENENGSHLAEKISNNYLQLRTRCWITPEAVFEIVGAGSKIPLHYKLLRSGECLTHKGPWIGVVICAVVALHHIDTVVETKYTVTAHIHDGEKHWRIPVPINFFAAGLENQLVFYWTRSGDLQRTVDSSQKNTFKFSFSLEPRDCTLEVTKFGVRFIQEKDIMQLTNLNVSTTRLVQFVFYDTLYRPIHIQRHKEACEEKQRTLLAMRAVVQHLYEINQEVFSECKEEWGHSDLFPLVNDYFGIIHGTSVLCNKGFRLLEAASDSWLSVKLALEQIVAKIRTENDYGYKEMLEQLNDLEAAKGIRFCDDFFTSFAFICMRIVSFSRHLYEKIKDMKKCKSMIRLEEVSSITSTCIFRILSTYMCTDKQMQELRRVHSYRTRLDVIRGLLPAIRRGGELRICDFEVNAVVLQGLKMQMVQFASFTRENEEEIMIVINKLEKMMNGILMTMEDMRRDAHLYSLDIR